MWGCGGGCGTGIWTGTLCLLMFLLMFFSPVVSEFPLIFFLFYSCYWSLLLYSFGSCSEILTRGMCFCFVSCDVLKSFMHHLRIIIQLTQ